MEHEAKINSENIIKSDKTRIQFTDSNFETEILKLDRPVIVHFSIESEYDLGMIPILDDLKIKYWNSFKFRMINIMVLPGTAAKYGVSLCPTFLIFLNGKVVEQVIGTVDKDTLILKLDSILSKTAEELKEISRVDLKKGYNKYRNANRIDSITNAVGKFFYYVSYIFFLALLIFLYRSCQN